MSIASAEVASENFRVFCRTAAYDVIFSNSRGWGQVPPLPRSAGAHGSFACKLEALNSYYPTLNITYHIKCQIVECSCWGWLSNTLGWLATIAFSTWSQKVSNMGVGWGGEIRGICPPHVGQRSTNWSRNSVDSMVFLSALLLHFIQKKKLPNFLAPSAQT